MNGVINILKPPGLTSHDVVAYLRRLLKIKKVGHTGTLDPGAAGVLPVCIGKATRLSSYITDETKEYRCEMVLGTETDTLDSYGEILSTSNQYPDLKTIQQVFSEFSGELTQYPPAYSAVKYKGKKLYEYAREGQELNIPPRKIVIYRNEIIKFTAPDRILFEVVCSKGTYIRSLCRDIGRKLGCGAYMSFLLRYRTGKYRLENSYTLDEVRQFFEKGEMEKIIIPMDQAVDKLPGIELSHRYRQKLVNGNTVCFSNEENVGILISHIHLGSDNMVRIYCGGQFIGIAAAEPVENGLCIKMKKVLV